MVKIKNVLVRFYTYIIYTDIGYDINKLPEGKLGFDLYKVNVEQIKSEIK